MNTLHHSTPPPLHPFTLPTFPDPTPRPAPCADPSVVCMKMGHICMQCHRKPAEGAEEPAMLYPIPFSFASSVHGRAAHCLLREVAGNELGTSSRDTDPPPAHPSASAAQGAEVPQVRAGVLPPGRVWEETGSVGGAGAGRRYASGGHTYVAVDSTCSSQFSTLLDN